MQLHPFVYCCLWLPGLGFLGTTAELNRGSRACVAAKLKISYLALDRIFLAPTGRGMGGKRVHSHFGDLFWTTKTAYGNTMGEGTNILKLNAIC